MGTTRAAVKAAILAIGLAAATATPAVAAGDNHTVSTAAVECPYYGNGVYNDTFDNYPGDGVSQTGWRAVVKCQLKPNWNGAKVRLKTSCSWGFSYYSDPVVLTPGSKYATLESPGQSAAGCFWGVSDYQLEQV
ncbi:hypothetical protein [Streptomyces sp. NPDC047097]|uniref:hypothetical protein n=1 Tax=Streptomyces sp. NPDC047097 TaxID=3155260 RepID=UPI003406D1D4